MNGKTMMRTREQEALDNLMWREAKCWDMAEVFLQNRDAHGIHDMGVEIQALQRAAAEIRKIKDDY
jgi:hypothetical protein